MERRTGIHESPVFKGREDLQTLPPHPPPPNFISQILIIKPSRCTDFSNLFFGIKLYMFRTVPQSIIRSFSRYTQQWYMSHRFADSLRTGSGWNWFRPDPVRKLWHIPLLCVQWKTPDDGQRNCPKHVGFYSKSKFEKLVHLDGFIIRIYHDARSPERQIY